MKISITPEIVAESIMLIAEHIEQHDARCFYCPIALAAQKAMNDPSVRCGRISLWKEQSDWSVILPLVAVKAIQTFDEGGYFEPLEFEVTI